MSTSDPTGREVEGDPSRREPPHLLAEADLDEVELRRMGPGQAAVYTRGNPLRDTPNEDAALLVDLGAERTVLAVADGVGGLPGARHASRVALEALGESLRGLDDRAPLRVAILDGIERAHAAVSDLRLGAATTLAVAEVDGACVRAFHVGDSGLLVIGKRGRVRLQTTFHSPVGYAIEAGLINEREAIRHADRHLLSNALGHEDMHVEIGSALELNPLDTLLLASDGLFDNLHTDEIAERIRTGDLAHAANSILGLARYRMLGNTENKPSKPDDLTFIVYRPAAAKG